MTDKQRKQVLQYLKFVLPTLEKSDVEKGYIWVNNPNNNFSQQLYFNSYNEGIALIEKYRHNECYLGLATSDGQGYKLENLINRNTILIDIDEEGLDIKEIYDRCKEVGIFAHSVVCSGRGWHIYLKLDKNYSIEEVTRVNKQIVKLFGADENACTSTQIVRVPHTKNFKVDTYASIVQTNNQVKSYTLKKLNDHKRISFKNNNTELEIKSIEDVYCFNQLVKNGVSKGLRNKAVIFISSTCKYAGISENRALQYSYEFNDNCKEPQRQSEVIKTVRSIYNNTYLVKPCTQELGQKLCSTQCKCKNITQDDILTKVDGDIDKDLQVGFTQLLFNSKIKVTRKNNEVERGIMLDKLTGAEILIISELKTFRNSVYTVESLVEKTKLSKPTVSKSLKTLVELGIVNATKQSINKSAKPTNIYFFNEECTQRYKEIIYIGRGLFICRYNKLITDSDMKVYLALKYLQDTNQTTTQLDIERISGVRRDKINRSLTNLKKNLIIDIDKVKTNVGHCNIYTLKL